MAGLFPMKPLPCVCHLLFIAPNGPLTVLVGGFGTFSPEAELLGGEGETTVT